MGLLKVSIYSVYSEDIIFTLVIAEATQVDLGREYRVGVCKPRAKNISE